MSDHVYRIKAHICTHGRSVDTGLAQALYLLSGAQWAVQLTTKFCDGTEV